MRSKLAGDAKAALSGLSLSNENYELAVHVLKERFGDVHDVVNIHYHKLINMQKAGNTTSSLRTLIDTMERHLRSLEVLKQDINQDMFVCMIRSKLPKDVLLQLEIQKGSKKNNDKQMSSRSAVCAHVLRSSTFCKRQQRYNQTYIK